MAEYFIFSVSADAMVTSLAERRVVVVRSNVCLETGTPRSVGAGPEGKTSATVLHIQVHATGTVGCRKLRLQRRYDA